MVSFAQLWEQIEQSKEKSASPLMSSGEADRALSVVQTGLDMHDENQASFWDELISLCSNADGLSQLLGVSRDRITSWPGKIKEALDRIEKHRAENPKEKNKSELMPTGDNGAFTTNTDPSTSFVTR